MPIGRPDWYDAGKSNILSSMSDMAELAVRLGSPISYDRSGKTIFYDVFERIDGVYVFAESGVGTGHALNTTYSQYGGSSVLTIINAGAANYVNVARNSRAWRGDFLSFEVGILSNRIPDQFTLTFTVYLDGVRYIAAIDIRDDFKDFYYYNTGAAFVLFAEETIPSYGVNVYNVLRLIFNIKELKYVGFTINEQGYDLSAYNVYQVATGASNAINCALRCYGDAAGALSFYLDHLVISEDL